MKHLTAAMLADSLARRSGVGGWQVEPVKESIDPKDNARIVYETKVKPPPGWTIVYGEDGSFTPCRMPKGVTFTFAFAEGPKL